MTSPFVLNEASAQAMAEHWVKAWNSRDINMIMNHFADNIEFHSPLIPRVLNEPGKTQLLGKEQIRHYFETCLSLFPAIHLKLMQVLLGVDSVAMYYESINGRLAVEVFFVDQAGKVYRTFNHYTTPKA